MGVTMEVVVSDQTNDHYSEPLFKGTLCKEFLDIRLPRMSTMSVASFLTLL